MTDDTKRVGVGMPLRQRHHEVDIERAAHPGEPRQVVSTDHEGCTHEPIPASRRPQRRERGVHAG
jgi:hypothetical protein